MIKRILVAEDEFIIALDLKNILKDFELAIARTADELIKLSGSFSPDLIITDINLRSPIDGITAVSQIQKSESIPVIFISAYADNFKDRLSGISDYIFIPKPINSSLLVKQVEYLLHERHIPVNF